MHKPTLIPLLVTLPLRWYFVFGLLITIFITTQPANAWDAPPNKNASEINEIDLSICGIHTTTAQTLTYEEFELSVCMQQAGPQDVYHASVSIDLPAGISFISGSYAKQIPTGSGKCHYVRNPKKPNGTDGGGVVTCDTILLNSGGSLRASLRLMAYAAQPYTFRARASGDPWLYDSPANNVSSSAAFHVIQRRSTDVVVDDFSVWIEDNRRGDLDLLNLLHSTGGVHVRLKFATRREIEVVSFRILRRDISAGENVYNEIAALNPLGQHDAGAQYQYIDANVQVDHVYGYRLVIIGYDDIGRVTPERKITIDILRRVYLPFL